MTTDLSQRLRAAGLATTVARIAVLRCLQQASQPQSADQLTATLRAAHPTLNRTTVYRELARLVAADLVEEVLLASRARVYELAGAHHHHAICTSCDTVAHVDIPEQLGSAEQLLRRQHGFAVSRHSLEFYGVCAPCQARAGS